MRTDFFKFFFIGIFILLGASLGVMLLWNWLIPPIFNLIAINFWQAMGLFVLARILLGSFGLRSWHRHGRMGNRKNNPFHQKWMQMTKEQRKDFIAKRHRFAAGRHFFDNDINEESSNRE